MHHAVHLERVMPRRTGQSPHTHSPQCVYELIYNFTALCACIGICRTLVNDDEVRSPCLERVVIFGQLLIVGYDDIRPSGYGIDHARGCTYKQKGRYVQ